MGIDRVFISQQSVAALVAGLSLWSFLQVLRECLIAPLRVLGDRSLSFRTGSRDRRDTIAGPGLLP